MRVHALASALRLQSFSGPQRDIAQLSASPEIAQLIRRVPKRNLTCHGALLHALPV